MTREGVVLKTGVSISKCHPMALKPVWVFRDLMMDGYGVRCVVTSAWDGVHGNGSFHHYGMAVDIRSKELPSTAAKLDIRDRAKEVLGNGYDVLLEALGSDNEHFHVEWEAGRPIREDWLLYAFLGGVEPEWGHLI